MGTMLRGVQDTSTSFPLEPEDTDGVGVPTGSIVANVADEATGQPRFGRSASSLGPGLTVTTSSSCAACRSASSGSGAFASSGWQPLDEQDVGFFDGEPMDEILPRLAEQMGWEAHAWGLVQDDGAVAAAWIYMLAPDADLVGADPIDFLFVVIEEGEALIPVQKGPQGHAVSPWGLRLYFAEHDVLHWFEGQRRLTYALDFTVPGPSGGVGGPGTGTVGGAGGTGGTATRDPEDGDPAPGDGESASALLEYTNVALYTRTEPGAYGATTLQGTVNAKADPAKWVPQFHYEIRDYNGSGDLDIEPTALVLDLAQPSGDGLITGDTFDNVYEERTGNLIRALVASVQVSLYDLFHDADVSGIADAFAHGALDTAPASNAVVGTTAEWVQWALGYVGPWLVEGDLLCIAMSQELVDIGFPDPFIVGGAACAWKFDDFEGFRLS